ncbi:LOW QUALITY PROTEIN: hypothetical protein Cgig2_021476 [Carnegiea gigantea]|uniref:Endonuclease/exonuclease/phosphatase domain-containing protein n=1 Tax=Carnegiea gigantea TaxID=171969 RepID=A0A9Q1GSZ5_9CARY|nr:LOW QUALITY PROTEIN: hypothetical protein Cgig2_021476 [Carnegiea gigantea]
METICSWNIRGLNWPNKQEDVKIFLHKKQIGLVGLLETKILTQSDQFIHCKATQNNTMKTFFITFVYGANHELRPLWEDLMHIAKEMDEAWYVLGDFNAVLYPGDRMGGTDELRNNGPYYTWTNKTIWTRIDRGFVNTYWYNAFDICQLNYMAYSLSDHIAMVLNFPWCPKPKPSFQFCNMWIRDPNFLPLMSSLTAQLASHDPNTKLKRLIQTTKTALQKLNNDKYTDLKTQLSRARADLEKVQLMLTYNLGDLETL